MHSYVYAVARESDLRVKGVQLSIEDYMALRRETVGVRSCFIFMEFVNGIDLPDEVYENKAFQSVLRTAIDIVAVMNVSPLCDEQP